jgi:hypothetical protein
VANRYYVPPGGGLNAGLGGDNEDDATPTLPVTPSLRTSSPRRSRYYVPALTDVPAPPRRSLFEGIEAGAPDTPADLGSYAEDQLAKGSDYLALRPALENVGGAVSAPFRGLGQGLTLAQEYLADVPEEQSRIRLGPEGGFADDFLGKTITSPTPASLALEGIKLIHQAPFGYADISKPGAVAGEEPIYRRAFEKAYPTDAAVEAVAEPVAELGLQFATDPALALWGRWGRPARWAHEHRRSGGVERAIGASFVQHDRGRHPRRRDDRVPPARGPEPEHSAHGHEGGRRGPHGGARLVPRDRGGKAAEGRSTKGSSAVPRRGDRHECASRH